MALGVFLKTIFSVPARGPRNLFFSRLFSSDPAGGAAQNFLRFETYILGTPEALHKISTHLGTNSLVRRRCCTNFQLTWDLFTWYARGAAQNSPGLRTYFLGTPEVLLKISSDFDPIISESWRLLRFFLSC